MTVIFNGITRDRECKICERTLRDMYCEHCGVTTRTEDEELEGIDRRAADDNRMVKLFLECFR